MNLLFTIKQIQHKAKLVSYYFDLENSYMILTMIMPSGF